MDIKPAAEKTIEYGAKEWPVGQVAWDCLVTNFFFIY
jgi:hypothetical protein